MNTSSLIDLNRRYGPALDEELRRWLNVRAEPRAHYGMLRYQLGYVDERFELTEASSGKRFRPVLCLLCCEGTGGAWQDALPIAAAIELLHNFSLIHDDIEDRDPLRRHRPAVWKVWGEPPAINAGDGMFALATRAVFGAELPDHKLFELAERFLAMSLELTEGQYLDMEFETREEVSPDEYLDMIGRKTSSLIAFSCGAGGIVGGATKQTTEALTAFGCQLGRAFQIRDDILDIWGESGDTGKEAAKDLQNRKKTLPILLALEKVSPRDRAQLTSFLARRSNDLDGIVSLLERAGIRAEVEAVLENRLAAAIESLQAAELDHRHRWRLAEFAAELTSQ